MNSIMNKVNSLMILSNYSNSQEMLAIELFNWLIMMNY